MKTGNNIQRISECLKELNAYSPQGALLSKSGATTAQKRKKKEYLIAILNGTTTSTWKNLSDEVNSNDFPTNLKKIFNKYEKVFLEITTPKQPLPSMGSDVPSDSRRAELRQETVPVDVVQVLTEEQKIKAAILHFRQNENDSNAPENFKEQYVTLQTLVRKLKEYKPSRNSTGKSQKSTHDKDAAKNMLLNLIQGKADSSVTESDVKAISGSSLRKIFENKTYSPFFDVLFEGLQIVNDSEHDSSEIDDASSLPVSQLISEASIQNAATGGIAVEAPAVKPAPPASPPPGRASIQNAAPVVAGGVEAPAVKPAPPASPPPGRASIQNAAPVVAGGVEAPAVKPAPPASPPPGRDSIQNAAPVVVGGAVPGFKPAPPASPPPGRDFIQNAAPVVAGGAAPAVKPAPPASPPPGRDSIQNAAPVVVGGAVPGFKPAPPASPPPGRDFIQNAAPVVAGGAAPDFKPAPPASPPPGRDFIQNAAPVVAGGAAPAVKPAPPAHLHPHTIKKALLDNLQQQIDEYATKPQTWLFGALYTRAYHKKAYLELLKTKVEEIQNPSINALEQCINDTKLKNQDSFAKAIKGFSSKMAAFLSKGVFDLIKLKNQEVQQSKAPSPKVVVETLSADSNSSDNTGLLSTAIPVEEQPITVKQREPSSSITEIMGGLSEALPSSNEIDATSPVILPRDAADSVSSEADIPVAAESLSVTPNVLPHVNANKVNLLSAIKAFDATQFTDSQKRKLPVSHTASYFSKEMEMRRANIAGQEKEENDDDDIESICSDSYISSPTPIAAEKPKNAVGNGKTAPLTSANLLIFMQTKIEKQKIEKQHIHIPDQRKDRDTDSVSDCSSNSWS